MKKLFEIEYNLEAIESYQIPTRKKKMGMWFNDTKNIKVGFQQFYSNSISPKERSKLVLLMKQKLGIGLFDKKLHTLKYDCPFTISVEIGYPMGAGNWDIDNKSFIWLKVFLDVITKGFKSKSHIKVPIKIFPEDNVNYYKGASYKYVESDKKTIKFTAYENS